MGRQARRRKRGRTTARGRGQHGAWAVWVGLGAVIVVGLAIVLAVRPMLGARSPAPSTAGREVTVSMAGFAPNALQARSGEDLTLTFVNPDSSFHTDGGGWHQFRIEALGVDVKIPPSSRKTTTLRDLRAGSYVFYCDVCCGGKENPAMRGVLEVTG